MAEWYNGYFGQLAGWGVLLAGIGLGYAGCGRGCNYIENTTNQWDVEMERVRKETRTIETNLVGGETPEKFILTHGGEKALIEVDGRPVLEVLAERSQKP